MLLPHPEVSFLLNGAALWWKTGSFVGVFSLEICGLSVVFFCPSGGREEDPLVAFQDPPTPRLVFHALFPHSCLTQVLYLLKVTVFLMGFIHN